MSRTHGGGPGVIKPGAVSTEEIAPAKALASHGTGEQPRTGSELGATNSRTTRAQVTGWPWPSHIPAGAVYVGRPSRWGNPHKVGPCPKCGGTVHTAARAVALYEYELNRRFDLLRDLYTIAGRALACWCPPGSPCHADVLIKKLGGAS